MAILGKTTTTYSGGAEFNFPTVNSITVTKVTVPAGVTARISKLTYYKARAAGGLARAVIYSKDAGTGRPSTVLATGSAVSLPTTTNTWVDLPLAASIDVAGGASGTDIFIGIVSDTENYAPWDNTGTTYWSSAAIGAGYYASGAYSPFPAGETVYTATPAVYATYTNAAELPGTLGKTTSTFTGGAEFNCPTANSSTVTRVPVPAGRTAHITKLTYRKARATGGNARAVIYAKDAAMGRPGALLALGSAVTLPTTADTWVDLPLASAIDVVGGVDIFIGVISDTENYAPWDAEGISYWFGAAGGDPYPSADDPFSASGGSYVATLAIYASYTYVDGGGGGGGGGGGVPVGTADVTNPIYAGGAKGDGTTNDTAAFQAAADTGKQLYIPAPPGGQFYRLQGRVNGVHGCTTDGSLPLIKMIGADGDNATFRGVHTIFDLAEYRGSSTVIFEGVHLDGGFTGSSGEHDHGIAIRSCSNVTVRRNVFEKCCGDGVYVASGEAWFADKQPSDNIVIDHNTFRAGKRCAVGLICATNVKITKNAIYSRSTFQASLDFEPDPYPNNPAEWVRYVEVTGNTFDTGANDTMSLAINYYIFPGQAAPQQSGDFNIHDNYGSWVALAKTSADGFVNITLARNVNGSTNPDPDIGAGSGTVTPGGSGDIPAAVGTGHYVAPQYVTVTGGGSMPDLTGAIDCASAPYSAVGNGTDEYSKLQAALDAAAAAGKPCVIRYTATGYKTSQRLIVKTSLIGVGATGVGSTPAGLVKIETTNTNTNALGAVLNLRLPMTNAWISGLHLVGRYVAPTPPGYGYEAGNNEGAHCIDMGLVTNVTIKGNRFENPSGDGIGTGYWMHDVALVPSGGNAIVSNVLITNNSFVNPYRCAVAMVARNDRWAIVNNYVDKQVNYECAFQSEPDQTATDVGGNVTLASVTNVEVGYNQFKMDNTAWDNVHQILGHAVGGWGVGGFTPGGYYHLHHNFGTFGRGFASFSGTSSFTAINDYGNNTVGTEPAGGWPSGSGGTIVPDPGGSGSGELAAYDTAVDALVAYMATLTTPVPWTDLSGNTTIDGPALRDKFSAVYVAKQALLNAMAAKTMVVAEAGGSGAVSSFLKSATFQQASAPTNPINGYTLKAGDAWYSTDTTTNCPDVNCTGHTLDANGNPRVGAYPHRSANWRHFWDGTAWKDGERKIVAGEIIVDMLRARSVITDNLVVVGNDNLVPNGTSDVLGPYGVAGTTGWPSGAMEAAGLDNSNAYQGTWHRLVTQATHPLVVTPKIPCVTGESVYAEAMITPSRTSSGATPCGRLVLVFQNAAGTDLSLPFTDPPGGGYAKTTLSAVAPANCSTVHLRFDVVTTGAAAIDNIVMRKRPASLPVGVDIDGRPMSDLWYMNTRARDAMVRANGSGSYSGSVGGASATVTRVAVTGGYALRLSHNINGVVIPYPVQYALSDSPAQAYSTPCVYGYDANTVDIVFRDVATGNYLDPVSSSLGAAILLLQTDIGATLAKL